MGGRWAFQYVQPRESCTFGLLEQNARSSWFQINAENNPEGNDASMSTEWRGKWFAEYYCLITRSFDRSSIKLHFESNSSNLDIEKENNRKIIKRWKLWNIMKIARVSLLSDVDKQGDGTFDRITGKVRLKRRVSFARTSFGRRRNEALFNGLNALTQLPAEETGRRVSSRRAWIRDMKF